MALCGCSSANDHDQAVLTYGESTMASFTRTTAPLVLVAAICVITQAQQELTLEERSAQALEIRCLAFSPDGKYLAAGTGRPESAGSVTAWDLQSKQLRWIYREGVGLPSVDFSPDGKSIAIGRYATAAKILNAETGKEQVTLEGHANHVRCVRFSPDGEYLFTGSLDRTVKIWDMRTQQLDGTLADQPDEISAMDISRDGTLLAAVSSRGKTTWIWDLKSRLPLLKLPIRESSVIQALFSPDGKSLLEASWSHGCQFVRLPEGEVIFKFRERHGTRGIAMSPTEKWIAIADSIVVVNRLGNPDKSASSREIDELIATLKLPDYAIREDATKRLSDIGLLAEPQLAAAMNSESPEVRWRTRRLREQLLSSKSATLLQEHHGDVRHVRFSADGQFLASGDNLGTIHVWRVGTWEKMASFVVPSAPDNH
jgi:WD40 repeat protein